MNETDDRYATLVSDLKNLSGFWRERERNSSYGFTEYGDRISALSGFDCADALDHLLNLIEL